MREKICRYLILSIMVCLWLPGSAAGQISSVLSESAEPSVPFLVEPVLPEPSIRLQSHLAPVDVGSGEVASANILVPMRLIGSFPFSERVVGEASMPVFIELPEEGDAGFEIGNPRIGLEAPLLIAGGRTHRWTFSLDLFLPLTQIGDGENEEEEVEAALTRARYGLMRAVMPSLSPDFACERLPVVVGTHYRLRLAKAIVQLGVDMPFLIGFNLDGDRLFDEGENLLRYGLMFGYDLQPVFPSLEVVGVTQLSGEGESFTAAMGSLGVRYAHRGFEPGLAVSIPIQSADDAVESSVIISLELVYRFRD